MKISVIGGVSSTAVLIEKLGEHGIRDVHVYGYVPQSDPDNVSGWVDLRDLAGRLGYGYDSFTKVEECRSYILRATQPDWIFVVGLSQLLPTDLVEIPRYGCIGFHPTALPRGRGRAPIAWMILEQVGGAATFFLIDKQVDGGSIVAQVAFDVLPCDDASAVEEKILGAERLALDQLLSAIKRGHVEPRPQDHSAATWFGRRAPEDGWIDWNQPMSQIWRLVLASTTPHPGAYTFHAGSKIKIWHATPASEDAQKGVVGRILQCDDEGRFVVQCGEGQLLVSKWESPDGWSPKTGARLGYYTEDEVYRLKKRVADIEEALAELRRKQMST